MYYLFVVSCVVIVARANSFVNLADVTCGVGGSGVRSARVVGGGAANPREFPWLGSLTRRGGHYCGATVLNRRWLLTAAHCICSGTNEILRPASIRASLGKHDLTQPEQPRAQEMRIQLIIPHPQHKCGRPSNDVALLQLAEDITWSEAVAPACLPEGPGGRAYSDYSGSPATVAGWGWLNEDSAKGGRANVLQKVDVGVLHNEVCQEWYTSQGKKTKISPGQMCAGDEQGGKDSCWADSGGPLVWSQGGKSSPAPVVIGVVSTGIGCGRPRLPGLYTRISEYMDWIQKTVQ